MHYLPRDSIAAVHPLSPTELSRYGPFAAQRPHSHSSQSSCPVHGYEPGAHQHEERGGRPPGLSFDPAAHGFHSLPGSLPSHARHREELHYLRSRQAMEVKISLYAWF